MLLLFHQRRRNELIRAAPARYLPAKWRRVSRNPKPVSLKLGRWQESLTSAQVARRKGRAGTGSREWLYVVCGDEYVRISVSKLAIRWHYERSFGNTYIRRPGRDTADQDVRGRLVSTYAGQSSRGYIAPRPRDVSPPPRAAEVIVLTCNGSDR